MKVNNSKYQLVANHVTDKIKAGVYKKGDRIPSINEFREIYHLSRDTVFAGLRELMAKGLIKPHHGVGYFIDRININPEHHIFLLFNELNEFKEDLFNSFMQSVGKNITVDLYFHNYNRKVFETLLRDANHHYTDYILMTGKFKDIEPLLATLSGRVLLLDHFHNELKGKYASVAQNFEKDTFEAMQSATDRIRKYRHIIMIQREAKEPPERYDGLKAFCRENRIKHSYLSQPIRRRIQKGDLFLVVKDRDLVSLLKQADLQQLQVGADFGIISYNDTPLKELLAGGITTLSTDFKRMGKTMARLVHSKKLETIENPWQLNIRQSL